METILIFILEAEWMLHPDAKTKQLAFLSQNISEFLLN